MELHVKVASDDQRRARQAAKKRKQREEKDGKTGQLSLGQQGTSRDRQGHGETSGTPPLPSPSFPTPHITPSFPPVAPTATERSEAAKPDPDAIAEYAKGLATAANKAITARWGEQINVIVWSNGHSVALAATLVQRGVPLELARSAIAAVIRKAKQQEPFRSLSYFERPILEEFDKAHQRQLDRRATDAPPSPREIEERQRKERDLLQGEYTRERTAALTRWRLDPANEADVERIQREANSRFAATSKSSDFEVRADRNRFIIAEESAAAEFPSLDEWLANRTQSPPAAAGTQ